VYRLQDGILRDLGATVGNITDVAELARRLHAGPHPTAVS
jgi:hypothetical protein